MVSGHNYSNSVDDLYVISTGGTIEKTYCEGQGDLKNRESILKEGLLKNLRYPYLNITVKSLLSKDSLDFTERDRETIKDHVSEINAKKVPMVIIHGTDTMALTGKYLQDHITELNIPVILTGAMRPLELRNSDATQNIIEAFLCSQLLEPGVYIVFHGKIFPLPHVQKNREKNIFEFVNGPEHS